MKKLLIIFVLLSPLTAKADYFLESALVAHGADWILTRDHSRMDGIEEKNPVINAICPNMKLSCINGYFLGTAIAGVVIHELIPSKHRSNFRRLWTIAGVMSVSNNALIVGASFKF